MTSRSFAIAALALLGSATITPTEYMVFELNFDEPASTRYQQVFEHFESELRNMENFWWNDFYDEELRTWFRSNLEGLRSAHPESYETNAALANYLGLEVAQTVGVSALTEVSTYCTSIVARNTQGQIAHARNLDFGYTKVMKQLVFEGHFWKGGKLVAVSPSIAGFYGAFTGQKEGVFSISFNARESQDVSIRTELVANLWRNLDGSRVTQSEAILKSLLEAKSFDEVVSYFETVPFTSPGHFTIGGLSGNQGVVLSRDVDNLDHRYELSQSQWYVAMTNVDVWKSKDARYEHTVSYLEALGQANIQPDGLSIIENVLWQPGVLQYDSIFTSTITSLPGTKVTIFDAPSQPTTNYFWTPEAFLYQI